MKVFSAAFAGLLIANVNAVTYGPANCVSISRSDAGSCIMTTDCEKQDLSHFEFAFNCNKGNAVERHSFGLGGFDTEEEYDTEVKCDVCDKPAEVVAKDASAVPHSKAPKHAAKKATAVAVKASSTTSKVHAKSPKTVLLQQIHGHNGKKHMRKANAKAKSKFWPFTSWNSDPEDLVKYGPKNCVSTWRSEEGHCMMKTDCAGQDIGDYDFGLVCVNRMGQPTRHLFGKGSFDVQEEFDTLIECHECLGLEDLPTHIAVNGQVMVLSNEIRTLKQMMTNISADVQLLDAQVFKGKPKPKLEDLLGNASASPAPAPVEAASPAPASMAAEESGDDDEASEEQPAEEQPAEEPAEEPAAALVVHKTRRSKHAASNQHHRGHFRRHQEEDEDDAEDEDDERVSRHRRKRAQRRSHDDDEEDDFDDDSNKDKARSDDDVEDVQ